MNAPNKEGSLREQAEYWLIKATDYDEQRINGDEGKAKFVEMAFKKALACEDAAIAAEPA